jgi:hypothetical protein
MTGPALARDAADDGDLDIDLDLAFGRRATSRFGTPIRTRGAAYRQTSGTPGAPADGEVFRPSRDLAAKRSAYAEGARSGSLDVPGRRVSEVPARPVIPGERRFRDGDRVRHDRFGDGIVVTSKLTRNDEEVTVAFRDPSVGRKTFLASLAALEITG